MRDLIRLYNVHSPSGECTEMLDYLCKWLTDRNVQFSVFEDCVYNLRNEPGYVLSAHMDQVKTNGRAEHFYKNGDEIRGYTAEYKQTNLGADDKNGIWLIMKALERDPNTNFIISVDEEIGCEGITKLIPHIKDKLANKICLVLDRRGSHEILNEGSQGKYCGTLAQDLCNYWGDGYHTGSGSISDTGVIADFCESVNISVGYYSAHSSSEYTNFRELQEVNERLATMDKFVHYNTPVDVYRPKYQYKQPDLWRNY